MAKRISTPRNSRVRNKTDPKAAWAGETHSGEGAASALAILQRLERLRLAARPVDPRPDDPA